MTLEKGHRSKARPCTRLKLTNTNPPTHGFSRCSTFVYDVFMIIEGQLMACFEHNKMMVVSPMSMITISYAGDGTKDTDDGDDVDDDDDTDDDDVDDDDDDA